MQPQLSNDGKLPVFIFPTTLTFYADDQSTHKQILTLYNPYDFPLKFNVLCTAPRKYAVVDPKGTIKASCCVDILIRHTAINPSNYEITDKFRVQVKEQGSRTVFGKKDVLVSLKASKPSSTMVGNMAAENDLFEHLPAPIAPLAHNREYPFARGPGTVPISNSNNGGPNLVVVLAAIVSLIALALPTEGQPDARLPDCVHLSVHQKLAAAFTLGLVAMSILKS